MGKTQASRKKQSKPPKDNIEKDDKKSKVGRRRKPVVPVVAALNLSDDDEILEEASQSFGRMSSTPLPQQQGELYNFLNVSFISGCWKNNVCSRILIVEMVGNHGIQGTYIHLCTCVQAYIAIYNESCHVLDFYMGI